MSSSSFNTIDFQRWSNGRSLSRQKSKNVLDSTCTETMQCSVPQPMSLNLAVNKHRFWWFSTINSTLDEIFPVILFFQFTKNSPSLAFFTFHSTYRVHNASQILARFIHSLRLGHSEMYAPLKISIKSWKSELLKNPTTITEEENLLKHS